MKDMMWKNTLMLTWYRNIPFVITQFNKSKWVEDNNHALRWLCLTFLSGLDSCFAKCLIKIKMDKHAKGSINVCGTMFYGVVPYLRTYSINLKPTMKLHLGFQETFVDNEGWLWNFFKGLQSILHNLTSKGVTIPLKYTQSLLDLFEYFEAPLDSNENKVCCEQGEVTCTSSYFLP
jgi:hypothetical protein